MYCRAVLPGFRGFAALALSLLLPATACRAPSVETPDEDDAATSEAGETSDPVIEAGSDAAPDVAAPVEACVPRACEDLGYDCGTADDGCGGTLHCGTCTAPETCSGGGAYNQCGTFPFQGGACFMECNELPDSANCNQLSDGCGHLMSICASSLLCSRPAQGTCGGGGVPFRCGTGGTCKPVTCKDLGYDCGQYGDGCSGFIDCGSCKAPDICGGSGFNRCGPKTAAQYN
jgi:hypothetical protein